VLDFASTTTQIERMSSGEGSSKFTYAALASLAGGALAYYFYNKHQEQKQAEAAELAKIKQRDEQQAKLYNEARGFELMGYDERAFATAEKISREINAFSFETYLLMLTSGKIEKIDEIARKAVNSAKEEYEKLFVETIKMGIKGEAQEVVQQQLLKVLQLKPDYVPALLLRILNLITYYQNHSAGTFILLLFVFCNV